MKFKRRQEAMLLLLPCVLLGCWVFWRRQPRAEQVVLENLDPYGPVLKSAALVPVTPEEVSRGWDSKFLIEVGAPRRTRQMDNCQYVMRALLRSTCDLTYFDGKSWQHRHGDDPLFRLGYGVDGKVSVLMKLRALPPSSRPTRLRVGVSEKYGYQSTKPGANPRQLASSYIASSWASVPVRAAGQRVALPPVSHAPPFAAATITRADYQNPVFRRLTIHNGGEPPELDAYLTPLFVQAPGIGKALKSGTFDRGDPYLEDEHGQRYSAFNVGGQRVSITCMADSEYERFGYGLPLKFIPASAGRLIFHTQISLDEGWPFPVQAVVREHDGRILTTSLTLKAPKNQNP